MIDPFYVSSMFVTGLVSAVLCFAARAKDDARLTRLWRWLLFTVFCWAFARAGMGMSKTHHVALILGRLSYAGSIWMGFLYLLLTAHVVRIRIPRWVVLPYTIVCASLFALVPTSLILGDVRPKLNFLFYDVPGGPFFNIFSLEYTGGIIAGVFLLIRGLLKSSGLHRSRIQYILLASAIGFGASATTFPLVNDIPIYPFGVPLIAVYPFLLSYAIIRHNVMDMNLAFRYALIWASYSILGVSVCVVPFIALGASFKPVWLISVFIAVGGSPFLFKSLVPGLIDLVDRLPFFRGRYLSRAAVHDALAPLQKIETLDQWPWAIVGCVKTLVPAKTCSVLVKDAGKPRLIIKAHSGLSATDAVFLSSPTEGPLAGFLRNAANLCVADHLVGGYAPTKEAEAIAAELSFLKTHVSIPVFFRGDLHAIVNVGGREDGRPYNELDLGHLTELARRSEHRLETIIAGITHQQMSSMWAHDLVKPFGPKGSMHLVEMVLDGAFGPVTPAMRGALDLVSGDIGFVKFNLHQVLRPSDVVVFRILPVSLDVPFARIREKYKLEAIRQQIKWVADVPDASVRVLCDSTIIEHRVLANLVENAFRHTPDGGAVTLGYKIVEKEFVGFVRDTGQGIRKEDQGKLFQPGVQLNKSEGGLAGLGLASVKTVVESHHGRVWIESEWGKGSAFFFTLPLDKKMGK